MDNHLVGDPIMTEIVFRNESGAWPETYPVNQETTFGGYCIGCFMDCGEKHGTGFIIKLTPYLSNICALALTAAHIFISDYQYENEETQFLLGTETFNAKPLKDQLNWTDDNLFYTDPISNCKVSIPEDWVIVSLSKIPGQSYSQQLVNLDFLNPSMQFDINTEVSMFGFPKILSIKEITYISPEANRSDFKQIKNSLCYGNTLVRSEGKILEIGEILSVSCITANGMSGGPLLIKVLDKYFVIGILFGGPASPLHHFITKFKNSYTRQAAQNLLQCLKTEFDLGRMKHLRILSEFLVVFLTSNLTEMEQFEFDDLLDNSYSKAVYYQGMQGKFIKYNNCIAIRTIFSSIVNILQVI